MNTGVPTLELYIPVEMGKAYRLPAWEIVWRAHSGEVSIHTAKMIVAGGAFEWDGKLIYNADQTVQVLDGTKFRAGRWRYGPNLKKPLYGRIVRG